MRTYVKFNILNEQFGTKSIDETLDILSKYADSINNERYKEIIKLRYGLNTDNPRMNCMGIHEMSKKYNVSHATISKKIAMATKLIVNIFNKDNIKKQNKDCIEHLNLNTVTYNALYNADIKTLSELKQMIEDDSIYDIEHLGLARLNTIIKRMNEKENTNYDILNKEEYHKIKYKRQKRRTKIRWVS